MFAIHTHNLFKQLTNPRKSEIVSVLFFAGIYLATFTNATYADLNSPVTLNIPKQTLSNALIELGSKAKISIIFPSELNLSQESEALDGNYQARQALDILLKDKSFEWQEFSPQVVSIRQSREIPLNKKVFSASPLTEIMVIGQQVTGSRLNRIDFEGSAPVDIITSGEISARGVQTISDYLKYIPAVSGNSTSTAVSNGGDGTATITLRGLASSNTLVLINGHRTANSGLAGDSVDLNSIPLSAVERIEVLKDGASAIYGSDAIAGVVNIILKKEFDGTVVDQYFSETSRNDLETSHTSVLTGFEFNKTRFMLSASLFDQEGIFSRDRNVSENADGRPQGGYDAQSSATPFTRITVPSLGTLRLLDENSDSDLISNYRLATNEDVYNYREETSSLSPSKRSALFLSAVHTLPGETELLLQIGQTQTEAQVTFAPQPLFTLFEPTPIVTGATNPYNPFGVDLTDLRRRLVELGPRKQNSEEKAQRINLQIENSDKNTQWDLNLNLNQTLAKKTVRGITETNKVRLALSDECLNDSACIPLNLFGPPGSIAVEQIAYIRGEEEIQGKSNLFELAGNGSASIQGILKNAIAIGSGFSLRKEETKFTSKKSSANSILHRLDGNRNVLEAYIESSIPLVYGHRLAYQLELDLALRFSDYSDFGNSSTPKIGIRYRPIKNLLIRGSYSEGFRAPSLYELHQGQSTSYDILSDPCALPENIGVLTGCALLSTANRLQIPNTVSGNKNLKPEQSTSKTFGFVWTPTFDFSSDVQLSIDWYRITLEDVIDSRAQFVIDQNAKQNLYSDQIMRDSSGNLIGVFSDYINVGSLLVEGFDTTLKVRRLNTAIGNYAFSISAANIYRYNQKPDPSSETINYAGTFADMASEGVGAIPNWKINSGISWSNDRWELNYNVIYINSLQETISNSGETRTIRSWTTQNIQVSYLLGAMRNFHLSAGIDNINDTPPPFAASAFNDNFDARTYELKGRSWYAKLRLFFN